MPEEGAIGSVNRHSTTGGRMIMLIDELDSLARHRSESHETTARMVSILLSEMDGLAESSQRYTIAEKLTEIKLGKNSERVFGH